MQCFDTLLEYLLNEISFRSNAGASVSDFKQLIQNFYADADAKKAQQHFDQQDENPNSKPKAPMGTDRRIHERVWKWLLAHPELDVQFKSSGTKYIGRKPLKKLSLTEAETLGQKPRPVSSSGKDSTGVRLFATEERLWIAIAGHEKDEKRLPASEFQLLTAIAAHGPKGVIQPDLVAYSGQDKRSVPRRTDVLRDKGYIVKDHVLSHGARTSICHLKRWSKSETQPSGLNSTSSSKPIIVQGTIHFDNLLDAIFHQLEVNNVVWLNDLKRNLGITSSRWACRAVMRTINELSVIGCVKRILCQQWESARLGRERWLRCIRLEREFTEQDREKFHSIWRCANRTKPVHAGAEDSGSDSDVGEDDKANGENGGEVEEVTPNQIHPQWSPDVPLSHFLLNMIEASGVAGIGSKEIHLRGVGDFYNRPLHDILTRITETWPQSQPPHLRHIGILRDYQLLNRASYFIYRTYENFQKAVELSQSTWEVATARTHPSKSGRSQKITPPEFIKRGLESIEWDAWGFPKFPTTSLVNGDGLATVQEAEKVIPLSTRSASADTFIKLKQGESGRPVVPGKRGRPRKYPKGQEPYRPKKQRIAMAAVGSLDGGVPAEVQDVMTTQQPQGSQNPAEVLDQSTPKQSPPLKRKAIEEGSSNALDDKIERQPQPVGRTPQSWPEGGLRDYGIDHSNQDPQMPPRSMDEPPVKRRGRPPKKKRKIAQRKALDSPSIHEARREDETEPAEATIQVSTQETLHKEITNARPTHGWTVANESLDSAELVISEPPVTPTRPRKKQRLSKNGLSVGTAISAPATPDRSTRSRRKSQKSLDTEDDGVVIGHEPNASDAAEERTFGVLINPPGSQPPRQGRGRPKKHLIAVFRSERLRGRDLASDPLPRFHMPESTIDSEALTERDEPGFGVPKDLPEHRQSSVGKEHASVLLDQDELSRTQDIAMTVPENSSRSVAYDKEPSSTVGSTEELSQSIGVEEMIQEQLLEETQQDIRQASPPPEACERSKSVLEDVVEVGVVPDDSIVETEVRQSDSHQPSDHQPNSTPPIQSSGYLVSENPRQGRRSRNPDEDTLGTSQPGKLLRQRVDVIMEIIDSCNGAFPGYNEIYQPFLRKWAEHGYVKPPDRATVNRAIKGEVDAGRLRKITFVFQDKHGIQVKRWILTRPEVAPTSELVRNMQTKICEAYPKQYLPGFENVPRQTRQPQYKEFVKEDFFLSIPDKPFYLKKLEERMNETKNKKRTNRTKPNGSRRLARLNIPKRRRQNQDEMVLNLGDDFNDRLLTLPNHISVEPMLPLQFVEDSDARLRPDSREADVPDESPSDEDIPDADFTKASGHRAVIFDPNLSARETHGQNMQELEGSNDDEEVPSSRPPTRGQPLSVMEKEFMRRLMQPSQAVNPSTGTYSVEFAPPPLSRGRRRRPSLRPHVQSVFEEEMPTSLTDMFDKFHTRSRAMVTNSNDSNLDKFSKEVDRVARWEQKQLDSDKWMLDFKLPTTRFINHSFYGSMPTVMKPGQLPRIVNYTADISLIQSQSTPRPRTEAASRKAEKANRPADRPLRGPGSRGGKIRPPSNRYSSLADIGAAPSNSHPVKQFDGTRLSVKIANRLLMSITVVRCLAGGDDMSIPWDLVLQAWPKKKVSYLQEQWAVLERMCTSQLDSLTRIFQETFLKAYERGEVPAIDYNDLENYDWKEIVDWGLVNVSLGKPTIAQLPAERSVLDNAYTLDSTTLARPEKEKFYRDNILRSDREKDVHKYFIHTPVTTTPLSHKNTLPTLAEDRFAVAISWLRATVITPNEMYDANTAQLKLKILGTELRNLALSRLLNNKTIVHHNKGRVTPGRNFRISETVLQAFVQNFRVQISLDQFREAAAYKQKLDKAFDEEEEEADRAVEFKRHNSDGAAMAIDNLAMGRRVRLVPRLPPVDNDIFATKPHLSKWGLTDRNYRSNQMPRERLYWPIDVIPTATYLTANPLTGALTPDSSQNPYPEPPGRPSPDNLHNAIPIWYSINGHLLPKWWQRTIALVLGFTAVRPGVSAGEIQEAIKSHIWPWELGLALQWLETIGAVVKTGGARDREARGEVPSYTTGEFWWLGVDAATRACEGRTHEGDGELDAGENTDEDEQAEEGSENGEVL